MRSWERSLNREPWKRPAFGSHCGGGHFRRRTSPVNFLRKGQRATRAPGRSPGVSFDAQELPEIRSARGKKKVVAGQIPVPENIQEVLHVGAQDSTKLTV